MTLRSSEAAEPACASDSASCAPPAEPRQERAPEASVTALSPRWGRLLDVDGTAAYIGVSRWTVYDLINAGVLPVVKLPSVRVDLGPRKTGNPKSRRRVLARPDFSQPLSKILIDRLDIDAWVDGLPRERKPA
jgi:predicted DNA-binding transcriptional regulator AlpA